MSYFGASSRMAGDPGFFGSLFKVIGKGVGILARTSPAGQVVTGISEVFKRPARPMARGGVPFITEAATGLGIGAGTVLAERALAGGCPPGAACPSGHHLNKSSYFLMTGEFVPEGSRCVRNRTRNPYNRKAATKAAGRLKSLGLGLRTIKKSVGVASRGLGNKS